MAFRIKLKGGEMGLTTTSRQGMTDDQIWKQIVNDCKSSQKTINCGSVLRRKAILEMERRLKERRKDDKSYTGN